ncbi:MAG: restriction endonuclease [Chloroflexi bacterium]|nr:restriction endonuclease [Chloroflexota bacterium]
MMNLEPAHRYDAEASVEKYACLLTRSLQNEYPNAQIHVTADFGNTRTDLEIQSLTQEDSDWKEEIFDMESEDLIREHIDKLAENVYQSFQWIIRNREWLPLAEISQRFQIPTSNLRWACKQGLLEYAKPYADTWEMPLDAVPSIKNSFPWIVCDKAMLIGSLDDSGRQFDAYKEPIPDILPDSSQILLLNPSVLGIETFSAANSVLWVSKFDNFEVVLEFHNDTAWTNSQWAYDAYISALLEQLRSREDIVCERMTTGRDGVVGFRARFTNQQTDTLQRLLDKIAHSIEEAIQETELSLSGGPPWKPEYEKSGGEIQFCEQVLLPLFHKMGYEYVRYTHGNDEFGRDFILGERTRFGEMQYYGVQVKAGDISGGAKSEINKILSQITLAFEQPFNDPTVSGPIYVTACIVAISGEFKREAKSQIVNSLLKWIARGAIFFLDQEKIRTLIAQCWHRHSNA